MERHDVIRARASRPWPAGMSARRNTGEAERLLLADPKFGRALWCCMLSDARAAVGIEPAERGWLFMLARFEEEHTRSPLTPASARGRL